MHQLLFLNPHRRHTGLDGGHIDNGAVQLLDLEAEIVDGDFKALDGLGSHQLEIHHARDLRHSKWLFKVCVALTLSLLEDSIWFKSS
jgi:hypothetical protein